MRSSNVIVDGWLNCSIAHTVGYKLFEMGFRGKVTAIGYEDMPCLQPEDWKMSITQMQN